MMINGMFGSESLAEEFRLKVLEVEQVGLLMVFLYESTVN